MQLVELKHKFAANLATRDGAGVVEQILHPYGVGIDTHSRFIVVCVLLRKDNQVIRHEKEFSTEWHTMLLARNWILKHVNPDQNFRYCIESTGCYHLPVIRALGGRPSIVNPLLAGPTRRKTDVLDARLLATHSITGLWKESFRVTDTLQTLRVLWAARIDARRAALRINNRITNILLRFGHTFTPMFPLNTERGRQMLQRVIAGKNTESRLTNPETLPPKISELLSRMDEKQQVLMAEAKEYQKMSLHFLKQHAWPIGQLQIEGKQILEYLTSIPGIGEATATVWLSEIGDPTRFSNIKQVAAYTGCDPSVKVSAGKVTSHTRRKGNLKLHNALLHAAQGLVNKGESPLSQWGKSIAGRHKKGGYRKACGAVARRLSACLWQVHTRCELFSFAKYNLTRVPRVPDVPMDTLGLGQTALSLLQSKGITTALLLAEAWTRGELASIKGFGDQSLRIVRNWMGTVTGSTRRGQEGVDETTDNETQR